MRVDPTSMQGLLGVLDDPRAAAMQAEYMMLLGKAKRAHDGELVPHYIEGRDFRDASARACHFLNDVLGTDCLAEGAPQLIEPQRPADPWVAVVYFWRPCNGK